MVNEDASSGGLRMPDYTLGPVHCNSLQTLLCFSSLLPVLGLTFLSHLMKLPSYLKVYDFFLSTNFYFIPITL